MRLLGFFLVCFFVCFFNSTYKWDGTAFVFLSLMHFTLHNALKFHPYYHEWENSLHFSGWIVLHYMYVLYIAHFLCPSIHHWKLWLYQWTVPYLVAQPCPTLCNPVDCSLPGSSIRGDSSGKNTRVGCSAFLQGVFQTLGSNPGLLHCRWILYCLSHQGSPRILEWVAYPFSRRSSPPRNQMGVSCIAGRFFPSWATSWAVVNSAAVNMEGQISIWDVFLSIE